MSVVSVDPKKYFLIYNGANVEGIKTMSLSFPNDDCDVEMDIHGNVTFLENPQGKKFELTVDLGKEQAGNDILKVPANAKTLASCVIMNSVTNKPLIGVDKSRCMITGWGNDDTGSQVPTNWKIIGATDKVEF